MHYFRFYLCFYIIVHVPTCSNVNASFFLFYVFVLPQPPAHSFLYPIEPPKTPFALSASIQAICKQYHQRIMQLEDAKYDLEYAVRQKEFVVWANRWQVFQNHNIGLLFLNEKQRHSRLYIFVVFYLFLMGWFSFCLADVVWHFLFSFCSF